MAQRISSGPDSTLVTVGRVTTTLAKLRTAHKAREAARSGAKTSGAAAHKTLVAKPLLLVKAPTNMPNRPHPVATRPLLKIGNSYGNGGLLRGLGGFVMEPSSMYSSTPADMKAFCAAAQASACAYLPPQQTMNIVSGSNDLADPDALIADPQCSQEGGVMVTTGGGFQQPGMPASTACIFKYQASVMVPFKPAASYKLAQSASCNSPWTYSVDVHGAIRIQLASNATPFATGSIATCVVRVSIGP